MKNFLAQQKARWNHVNIRNVVVDEDGNETLIKSISQLFTLTKKYTKFFCLPFLSLDHLNLMNLLSKSARLQQKEAEPVSTQPDKRLSFMDFDRRLKRKLSLSRKVHTKNK